MSEPVTQMMGGGEGADMAQAKYAVKSDASVTQPHSGGSPGVADASVADAGSKSHISHHEVKHHRTGDGQDANGSDADLTPEESRKKPRSAIGKAWDASKDKIIEGAKMFAGFAAVLGVSMAIVGTAGALLTGNFTFASVLTKAIELVPTVIATAMAGAAWMGGNAFIKKYREHKQEEAEREAELELGKDGPAKDKAKEAEKAKEKETAPDSPQRVGEFGIVAGSLSSRLGGTAFLIEVPSTYVDMPATNKTVSAILAEGPKSSRSAILERGSLADLSAIERAERIHMEAEQQASL